MPITRAYGQASQLGNTPAASNPILNSAFQVWQRGTSFTGAGTWAYMPDRWQTYNSTATSISRQVTGDTTNLPNIQYCARNGRNNAATDTSVLYFYQSLETANSIPFAGKTITFSFYARRGANFSATANTLVPEVITGTGTDQNALQGGFTGGTVIIQGSTVLTTTWQRFSYTANVASNVTQICVGFKYTPTGTAGAADYYEVTGVQLEVGSVALPFRTYSATLAGELAACQRYYQKSFEMGTAPTNGNNPNGQVYYNRQASSGSIEPTVWVKLAPSMRTAPSVTLYNPYLASPTGQWSDGSISSANARTINIGDSGFAIDNNDVSYATTNYAIHYAASSEL